MCGKVTFSNYSLFLTTGYQKQSASPHPPYISKLCRFISLMCTIENKHWLAKLKLYCLGNGSEQQAKGTDFIS